MSNLRVGNRLGEFLRFIKYLPTAYRGHVLELQRRFHGLEEDQRVLYFTRDQYIYAPNEVTAFRVWRQFFAETESAAEITQFLRLGRGCTRFLDIGAAHGLFSAIFCRTASESARVVAVEPIKTYVSTLEQTLALNAGPNVDFTIEQTALMDRNDQTQFSDMAFDGFFTKLTELVDSTQEIQVETLESLCQRLDFKPDLIKMDVDGFEYDILLGSPSFFRTCLAKLHLELHLSDLRRRGKDVNQILDHLFQTHTITATSPQNFSRAPVARLSLEPK